MNRKQRIAYTATHSARRAGQVTKDAAKDAAKGASLLGRFAIGTLKGVALSTKNAAADVRQGAKYGWKSAQR